MTLIAGSYEKFIWGFSLSSSASSDETLILNLKRLFTYPSHLSPITAVASASPLAASSSSGDSSVHLYHLPSSASLGSTPIPHPSTCLAFYSSGHLISGSSDGNVSIFDTDPFVLLKSIPMSRGKMGGLCVNDVAVHGSGRLALAIGRGRMKGDGWLGMVNLVRGRRSYVGGGLGGEGRLVGWAGEGGFYAVVADGRLGWHAAEDARRVWEVECDKRVLCAEAASQSGLIYTGGEDRNITAWDTNSGRAAFIIEGAHSSRIKGIVIMNGNDEASGGDALPSLVSSASSDGVIRVWDVRFAMKERPNPLAEVNTKSRLTCLAGTSFKSLKRKRAGGKNLLEDEPSHEESYVKSRSDNQLLLGLNYSKTSSCKPEESSNGQPIVPCGLISWSLFNDSYAFSRGMEELKVNRKDISWRSDREHKFRKEVYPFDFQNGTFIGGGTMDPNIPLSDQEYLLVWMRTAALPNFRKLYGRIEEDLQLDDFVEIILVNNYNTDSLNGKKKLVLSTSSWLRGKNDFLGVA